MTNNSQDDKTITRQQPPLRDAAGRRPSFGLTESLTPPSRPNHQFRGTAQQDDKHSSFRTFLNNHEVAQDEHIIDNDEQDYTTGDEPKSSTFSIHESTTIIMEGPLGLNRFMTRYFCVFENGTVHVYLTQKERELGKIEARMKLQDIWQPKRKRIGNHNSIRFIYQSGIEKEYKTNEKEAWIKAGRLLKVARATIYS